MGTGITLCIENHVARVTIDRPKVLNALDHDAHIHLEEIWQGIENNPDVFVVVVTGAGDQAFCTGADMSIDGVNKNGVDYWADGHANGFGGLALRETLDVPIIARINGYALGGGLEMALGCDILVASENAQIGLPEPRVGRIPLDGGVIRLVRQAPFHQAMGVLLTGKRISAEQAYRMGLLNEVVPVHELDAAVERWVNDILACAPLSLRAIKHMVQHSAHLTPREAQSQRSGALVAALRSEDSEEGLLAFREKRTPRWIGR